MKNALKILALLILTANVAKADNVMNITENMTINSGADQFSNYTINIASGVTVTVDMPIYLTNVTINGGTLILNQKLTYWSASTLNNVTLKFYKAGGLVSSGVLTIKNSTLTFYNATTALIYSGMDVTASRIKLLDNSNLEATKNNVNLRSNSAIVVGDGTTTSHAFVKFNGASLIEYDNSFITVANYNNYYFNWANYTTTVNNKSFKTTNNNMNCDVKGKNDCSSPVVYGPATLNYGGVSSSAVLPVKLIAFGVKSVNDVVEISWTTAAELNAEYFVVERSTDGQNWVSAGKVAAAGNSSQDVAYSLKDALKVGGKVQYRLKMVDQDGSFAYSPIRTVNATGTVEMAIYPNPATNYVVINTKNGAADQLNIQLINHNGQVLKQINGNGNTMLSVSEFQTGNYIVRVSNGSNISQSFKLMIQK